MNMKSKNYHIMTLGCQMNKSDSERIGAVLKELNYTEVDNEKEANLVVVNACAVRQSAMDRIYGKLERWNERKAKEDFKTLLTGCVLKADREKMEPFFDWFLEIKDLGNLPGLLGHEELHLEDYFQVNPKYNSDFSAFVPIMTGCDKFCTFCAVPYTRGREISRPYNDILKECEDLIKNGCKEITLLGQNVNSYVGDADKIIADRDVRRVGKQILNLRNNKAEATTNIKKEGTMTFPELLQKVADIPGDFWIRFTSSHPYDMSDELIDVVARNKKVANQMLLAVQSGSDSVLKRMNRHHTIEHYLNRMQAFKDRIPDITISTDIIVGFCGETEEEFQKTVDLMKTVEFDMAYIARYSPRPGTVAEKLFEDDIDPHEKIRRDKHLNEVLKEIVARKNKEMEGKTYKVLVESLKKEENGFHVYQARTEGLKPIRFKSLKDDCVGRFVNVKVISSKPWSLEGELV